MNQNIRIQPTGLGDIEFYPSGGSNIEMKGTVEFQAGKLLRTSDGSVMKLDQAVEIDGDCQADTFNGVALGTIGGFNTALTAAL